jgi:hypothetical protein
MRWLSTRRRPAWIGGLFGLACLLGPYLAIELLLPGGSLVALLLWLHRRIHHR